MDEQEEKQSGWWGATLSKLKGALSKTKSVLVDAVVDRDESEELDSQVAQQLGAQPAISEEPAEEIPVAQPHISVMEMDSDQVPSVASPQLPPPVTPDQTPADRPEQPSTQPLQTQPVSTVAPVEVESEPTPLQPAASFTPVPRPTPLPAAAQEAAPQQVQLAAAQVTAPRPVTPAPAATQAPAQTPRPTTPARAIDDDYLEDLEEKLIKADIGLNNVEKIVADLRREARAKNWNSHNVEAFLRREFESMLATAPSSELKLEPNKLNIVLVVGVNGTGKTTSIGKLCWRLKQQGKKVLMAAGDTFRAAAETQLEIWAERAGVDIVRLPEGSDPGAVVYQAIQKATAENYEVLIIDTAGRLHNKANLMAELKKVRSVVDKQAGNANIESLLVIDASTGQNGLQQAKVFTEFCPLTGVVLTKLDGSAKGGIVFSIARDLKLPVKLIGLGEQIDDLRLFDPRMFVEALF